MKEKMFSSKKLLHIRKKTTWSVFLHFPIVWMISGVVGLLLVDTLFRQLTAQTDGIMSLIFTLLMGFLAIMFYKFTMKHLAQQTTPEISGQRAILETLLGILIGTLFIIGSALIIMTLGGYSFEWASSMNTSSIILSAMVTALGAAIIEELIFRGLMFQAIDKLGGKPLALVVTSLFFGIAHLGNTGATLWSAFAIALEAGVLLGAAFMWRKNLWFVMGLHFAWNTIEGLLGIPVSGHPADGLFTVEMNGSALLTGGEFGLEASIIPVVISLLISIPMLFGAAKNKDQKLPLSK